MLVRIVLALLAHAAAFLPRNAAGFRKRPGYLTKPEFEAFFAFLAGDGGPRFVWEDMRDKDAVYAFLAALLTYIRGTPRDPITARDAKAVVVLVTAAQSQH